jgi:uncharacterized repeat protein (TIGR04076 family)
MAESYDVAIKVISQKGTCSSGHQVGDQWVFSATEHKTPGGICLAAYNAIFPYVNALMWGGEFPWAAKITATRLCCIDGDNPVEFEVKRLPK